LCLQKFTDESLVFQEKILTRSGLGQKTYLPPAVACSPPCPSMQAAREEFEEIMFSTVQNLLDKTGGWWVCDQGVVEVLLGCYWTL
jgi:3-ketoacyl-CoA synthase